MLARLQLSGIRDQLDSLLDEAARANLSARETLILLCEREIARKDHRRIDMALKLAHFPAVKELAGFDFEAQPSIDPKQIRDLAASRWIANGENVLLLGPPGVGKTHLSIALGREAILAGYTVQFTTATTLVAGLAKAHGERRLDEKLLALSKPKLLIVDELGYLPLEPDAAHLFFQLVSRRYETGAMLITSNRSVAEWGTVFADPVVATAILDRLLHHSHVLTIRGDSYRLRAKRKSGLIKTPTAGDGPPAIINLRHPLVRLAAEINWDFLAKRFSSVCRVGPGQPPLPTRLVAGLFILKHMHNLSDESLCDRWVENPYFQYLSGEAVFRHELPFDRSSLTRWRQRLGEEQIAALLQESLSVAHRSGAIETKELERGVVDTTVQEKASAHPTDARLTHRAIEKL
ncbi:hypothetical protein KXV85_009255, partial [Aspergillus fumigatus]